MAVALCVNIGETPNPCKISVGRLGVLAGYLYDRMGVKKADFVIEQGYLMPNPSLSVIFVRLKISGRSISGLMAGGKVTISEIRSIDI